MNNTEEQLKLAEEILKEYAKLPITGDAANNYFEKRRKKKFILGQDLFKILDEYFDMPNGTKGSILTARHNDVVSIEYECNLQGK